MLKWNVFKVLLLGLPLLSCTYKNTNTMTDNRSSQINAALDTLPPDQLETATIAGGCFWCIEAVFDDVQGVYAAESGYSGGTAETADYKTVCTGTTKHAEVVQIKFNPQVISFEEILEIFWNIHDPTTLNRQGNDVGPQYRSAIFYHNEKQKAEAEKSIKETAAAIWEKPIVTEVAPFEAFYPAEDYHQDYYNNVGDRNPYCTIVITPKVQKFKKLFGEKVKQ